jgi:hypothetical protein
MTLGRCILTLIAAATVSLGTASAQTTGISITPDTTYSRLDTTITLTINAGPNLIGVKGFHFDIDFNDAGVVIAPADGSTNPGVSLGTLFDPNDTATFMWDYLWIDSTRLTVDIFVLTDSQTVSGPGELLVMRMNTVELGETAIEIAGLKLRDRFNEDIPATTQDAWIAICRLLGDVNGDNQITVSDLTYLVDFLFRGGPDPEPYLAGDLDCSGFVNVSDVVKLVDYLFRAGTIDCDICL